MKVITCNTYGEFNTNAYLVIDEEENTCVLIDPDGDANKYIEYLDELNVELKAILITHGHFDHIGAVNGLKEKLGIPVVTHEVEAEVMKSCKANLSLLFIQREVMATADTFVNHSEVINFGGQLIFKCIIVPGHSEKSVCYYNKEHNILFSGDTLFNTTIGRRDLYSGDSSDLEENIRKNLCVLPENTKVYPGHNAATTIKEELEHNPFLR